MYVKILHHVCAYEYSTSCFSSFFNLYLFENSNGFGWEPLASIFSLEANTFPSTPDKFDLPTAAFPGVSPHAWIRQMPLRLISCLWPSLKPQFLRFSDTWRLPYNSGTRSELEFSDTCNCLAKKLRLSSCAASSGCPVSGRKTLRL